MKLHNRILAVLLVIVLVTAALPTAMAKGSSKEATAGSSVALTFSYSDIYGLSGEFSLEDPDGIVESWKATGHSGGLGGNVDPKVFLFSLSGSPASVTVTVTVKLKSTAQPGQTASIRLSGTADYDALGTDARSVSDTAKVTVIRKTTPVEPTPPPPVVVNIDYTALERQIAVANGLSEGDYTLETWTILIEALTNANTALTSKVQEEVDAAALALENAIAGLIRMDYTALEAALQAVNGILTEENLGELWVSLGDAVSRGKALIGMGDQAAVDAVTAEIHQLLLQLEEKLSVEKAPEVIFQEVVKEVPPSGDFCNIPMHRIWPVLFFASLGLNIALIVLLVLTISRKKRKTDDTPLVDYDIDEDIYE